MAVNKIVYNTEDGARTLIDLTRDTVTPETLAEGVYAHDASGNEIVGTMKRSEDLDTVLTEQEALITELKKALAGKASGGGGDTMVGTWEFNEELDITLEGEYYVSITKPTLGTDVEIIGLTFYDQEVMGLLVSTDGNYIDYYENGFVFGHSRLITITEEPTDSELIAWIKANARKLGAAESFETGYAEGEKAILSTYIDWSVSSTSSLCIVGFYSDTDYYAHIYCWVGDPVTGNSYSEEFVLEPYGSYSIDTEEVIGTDVSGEWSVNVTIMGFSKDGEK